MFAYITNLNKDTHEHLTDNSSLLTDCFQLIEKNTLMNIWKQYKISFADSESCFSESLDELTLSLLDNSVYYIFINLYQCQKKLSKTNVFTLKNTTNCKIRAIPSIKIRNQFGLNLNLELEVCKNDIIIKVIHNYTYTQFIKKSEFYSLENQMTNEVMLETKIFLERCNTSEIHEYMTDNLIESVLSTCRQFMINFVTTSINKDHAYFTSIDDDVTAETYRIGFHYDININYETYKDYLNIFRGKNANQTCNLIYQAQFYNIMNQVVDKSTLIPKNYFVAFFLRKKNSNILNQGQESKKLAQIKSQQSEGGRKRHESTTRIKNNIILPMFKNPFILGKSVKAKVDKIMTILMQAYCEEDDFKKETLLQKIYNDYEIDSNSKILEDAEGYFTEKDKSDKINRWCLDYNKELKVIN